MSLTWVVGGTSGIGFACAKALQEIEGQFVIISGREVDVRDKESLLEFLSRKREPKSTITGLIYSAGITGLAWSSDVVAEEMLDIYHVNVVGLVNVLQVVPHVKRVVVIGSDAAWREMRTSISYCASKAALHQAVRVIAKERASEEFAINVVAPGMTEPTRMQQYIDNIVPSIRGWSQKEARKYEDSQVPMRRRASVTEVADVVVSVMMSRTNYLNGAIIPVNGGR